MYTVIHSQSAKDNITTSYFYAVMWRHAKIIVRDHVVLWQLLHAIVYWTIRGLVYCSPERLYIKRMVLLFSKFFIIDPKYLCFNEAKNRHIVKISGWLKCYGDSTKHNGNVCCTLLLRLVLRPIAVSVWNCFNFSPSWKDGWKCRVL